jgi:hypothetical protein
MTESQTEAPLASRVKFNYVKSNLFRVIHADGAVVAVNPNQNISINLFSQRFSIPDESIVELDEDGRAIGETTSIEIEENIDYVVIREIDVLAVMSLDGARQLIAQLQDILEDYEDEEEHKEE